jgi:hypothetical protein
MGIGIKDTPIPLHHRTVIGMSGSMCKLYGSVGILSFHKRRLDNGIFSP